MKCQTCGQEYNSNFCPNCGAKSPQPTAYQPTPPLPPPPIHRAPPPIQTSPYWQPLDELENQSNQKAKKNNPFTRKRVLVIVAIMLVAAVAVGAVYTISNWDYIKRQQGNEYKSYYYRYIKRHDIWKSGGKVKLSEEEIRGYAVRLPYSEVVTQKQNIYQDALVKFDCTVNKIEHNGFDEDYGLWVCGFDMTVNSTLGYGYCYMTASEEIFISKGDKIRIYGIIDQKKDSGELLINVKYFDVLE